MPPGARRALAALLSRLLGDAVAALPPAQRHALRGRARDFVLDLGDVNYVTVEGFAADALCALAGDLADPDHARAAGVVAVRVVLEALSDPPAVVAFAELGPLLEARPIEPGAVRAYFARRCAGCSVREAFR